MSHLAPKNEIMLTIAIPTYNRAPLLKETLESIILQIKDNIEVVVCSNASNDGTDDMMARYCHKFPFIRYVRSEINTGIDANIHKCTQISKGRFIHLLSDDDILLEGAVDNLIQTIASYPKAKFFYYNAQIFEGDFNKKKLGDPIFSICKDSVYENKDKFVEHIWIWATFLSSFIIEKETWNKAVNPEQYIGTDIYLSYMLFELLSRSEQEVLIARPSIAIRAQYTGNYRIFYAFAWQWRLLLLQKALELGYNQKIMKNIFRKSIIRDILPRVVQLKVGQSVGRIDKKSLEYIFRSTYDFFCSWIILYPIILMPRIILKNAWKLISKLGFAPNNFEN